MKHKQYTLIRGKATTLVRARTILLAFCLFWLGLPSVVLPEGLAAAGPEADSPAVSYMIVVTGGELLAGEYADGHTQFITSTLGHLGLKCVGSMCVDDKENDLTEAMRYAQGKAKLVVVTGGLGPTPNDITRETLSRITGIKLAEHPDVLADMERRFRTPASQIRANLRQQTQTPVRGTYFKNPNGTAVGLVFEGDSSVVVALPGPPRELQPMVRDELVPYLNKRLGTRLPGHSMMLRFVGLGQSQIDQLFDEEVPLPEDVTVSSTFEGGRVDFIFSLPDDTPEGRARLEQLKRQIMMHLGDNVYADSRVSLEEVVVNLLKGNKTRLALIEAGSGGSLTAAINGVDDAREVLAGAYVAPSLEMLGRMLDGEEDLPNERAAPTDEMLRMVEAAAAKTGAGCVVVVDEARRDLMRQLYIEAMLSVPDKPVMLTRLSSGGSGETARQRLTTQLLDQLRRRLKDTQEQEE